MRPNNPDISIVVLTYNRSEMLRNAVASLIQQDTDNIFSFNIVIIDNGSTDKTPEVVEKMVGNFLVPVLYVRETGIGVAQARNRGIKESKGEWIAFFDDDQVAEKFWLKELFSVARIHSAWCVGGSIQLSLPVNSNPPRSLLLRAALGEANYGDKPIIFGNKSLPGTGNVLIKRTVFNSLGQFDGTFIRGGEDTEFFRRFRKAGFNIWYAPRALAYHVIPHYRLKNNYLLWVSLRHGANYAYCDYKEGGLVKVSIASTLRIGKAILQYLPAIVWSYMLGNGDKRLENKFLISRNEAYLRVTLLLLFPLIFKQSDFFARLEFGRERKIVE
jgi:GT2 family glycosyltransferase